MNKNFVTTFITLPGQADEAMALYVRTFPDAEILQVTRYESSEYGVEGKVMNGQLRINDSLLYFMDFKDDQAPMASWRLSLYIDIASEKDFDQIFEGLAHEGVVLMGPEAIMGLQKVAWITDVFGITWQLVFA